MNDLRWNLADTLSRRSEEKRQLIVKSYEEQYGNSLEKDIQNSLRDGTVLYIIHLLLNTRDQHDVELLNLFVRHREITPAADILCCRSQSELQQIQTVYREEYKSDLSKLLQDLARREKKHTLSTALKKMLSGHPRCSNVNQEVEDLQFLTKTRKFVGAAKEKLVC